MDDEVDVLNAMKRLVKRKLPRVQSLLARSGDEALRVLEKEKIDLIVTDYRMPGMDGLEFLRRASEIAPHVPRVMITAYPDPSLAVKSAKEGDVSLLVTKPFDYEYFVGVIGAILDRAKPRPRAA